MDRIRRNEMMYKLSIVALVLYVLLILISMTSHLFIRYFEKVYSFRLIVSNSIIPIMMIGYIAIYVLWTPDNEGNIRKRPTWQFVLLLVAYVVPSILTSIISQMMMNINYDSAGAMSDLNNLSVLNSTISYTFLPIWWAMLIIFLVKCERKAKKILIISVISGAVGLVNYIGQSVIRNMDFFSFQNNWITYFSIIMTCVSIVLSLLYLVVTIVYTKQKYKEVYPMGGAYIGGLYDPLKKEPLDSSNSVDSWK